MSIQKRRSGYLATAEGVKKLKEAKRIKKYTYRQIAEVARKTEDKVKRLFNPQWGNGKYEVGEQAVEAICDVLDLKPEEIVSDWYPVEITSEQTEIITSTSTKKHDPYYYEALKKIEQAAKEQAENLYLWDMELTELPPEIVQLSNLKYLYLDNNSLSSQPPEIVQLSNLTVLDLKNNSLSSLPPEIAQLSNLTVLDLSNNSLSSLLPEIVQLSNLTHLGLSNNSLSSLPPEIVKLSNLTYLYLSNNSLSSLPPEIVQLSNLTYLYLSNNSLSSLPPEIVQLSNLTVLDLSNNSLSSLPPEIGQLSNLTYLDFSNNSLPISPEVIQKYDEPATIINYYLSLQSNQQKPLHEAKMLLVGQGNVGKTCLRERLIRNQYDPTRNKTDGIDIENWKIKIEDKEIQVNIWDFGGQEIMHSTHQFFLTKRSLYLLVVDTTQSEEENRIEYWLKIIQSFGKDAPVIIVGNKADQHPLDIDQNGLKQKYPQIKDFYEVSCETGIGINELTKFIKQEINQLEHIDDLLPLPWFNIKQKLEELDKDYIPYEEYESLCEKEKVEEEQKQRILIRLLNDLGIVLNFQDDPRLEDTHVLNPEWVTKGVYKILNDRELIVENRGILNLRTLKRILYQVNKKRYPAHKHLFIIGMMRKFELCFVIETDKQWLIPDILPKEEPYTGEWDDTLTFEYHYSVLPNSIISRFIVRMNHYIHQKTYWRSGVVLAHEGNTALVKADREDRILKIRVKGIINTRRNLLTAIRSQFDYIHSTIPGIKPEQKVKLLGYPEIPPVNYEWLLELERRNKPSFIPPGLTDEINLRELLKSIESETIRRSKNQDIVSEHDYIQKVKRAVRKEISKEIFISYSWATESKEIADQLEATFQTKGIKIMRDISQMQYKDRIQEFMKNIGRGKCVIVIISQAYLKSENCMFELLQIAKNGNFYDRIFPIVLPDAKIYKPVDRIKYVQYWEQEIHQLDEAMKTVSSTNLHGFRDDIDLYNEIRNNIPQLTNILKDINALTTAIHSKPGFTELIKAVELRLME